MLPNFFVVASYLVVVTLQAANGQPASKVTATSTDTFITSFKDAMAKLDLAHSSAMPLKRRQALEPSSPSVKPLEPSPPENLIPNGQMAGAFNWCGSKKVVVLSFDDGPHATGSTEDVLDDLKELNMTASFFLAPNQEPFEGSKKHQCEVLKKIINAGHSVHGHTNTHPDLSKMKNEDIIKEIDDLKDWFQQCTGQQMQLPFILRPPFGYLLASQRQLLNDRGISLASWNVDSDDWRGGGINKIYDQTMTRFNAIPSGGSAMILHHDAYYTNGNTKGLLKMYKNSFEPLGYRFITATECLRMCSEGGDCSMPDAPWPGVWDEDVHA